MEFDEDAFEITSTEAARFLKLQVTSGNILVERFGPWHLVLLKRILFLRFTKKVNELYF